MKVFRKIFAGLGLAIVALGMEGAVAAPSDDTVGLPALPLARQGHMYVGGRYQMVGGRPAMVGQMYVDVFVPARKTHPYPIIMVHGGGSSGVTYEATVDGREGWAPYFVRRGYAVYVVDQVGRGRSPYEPEVYGPSAKLDSGIWQGLMVSPAKNPLWPQASLHTQWPGGAEPGDPVFDRLMSSVMPAIKDYALQQSLNTAALVALLDRIGPAILLVHSQAGAFAWPVADARPDLVKAILAIEPNGPPVHDIEPVGPPTWFRDRPDVKPSGLGAMPLTYSPPVKDPAELAFVRESAADSPGHVVCWRQAEPARQLPNLQKPKMLILTGEASYHVTYDQCTVRYLRQAGVRTDWIQLPALGIRGNGHVMMQEKNSDAIAAVLADWLEKARLDR